MPAPPTCRGAPPVRDLPHDEALALLRAMSHELRDVDVGHAVPRVSMAELTPLRFATEYLAKNKPCIITGAIDSWPALQRWTPLYLFNTLGDLDVTVDVTPDGRGDAVACAGSCDCFVTPEERRMPLGCFFTLLHDSRAGGGGGQVPYVQHQNNSLSEEFSQLLRDVRPLQWADDVFGGAPEATNLWIGDERSVTSFHKDHYENLYAVIVGTKRFTLLPPSDVYRMYLTRYPAAQYVRTAAAGDRAPRAVAHDAASSSEDAPSGDGAASSGRGSDAHDEEGAGQLRAILRDPSSSVVWSPIDPYPAGPHAAAAAAERFPLFFDPSLPAPLTAEVHAGEVLYLPSMWYHHVRQRVGTLAASRGGAHRQNTSSGCHTSDTVDVRPELRTSAKPARGDLVCGTPVAGAGREATSQEHHQSTSSSGGCRAISDLPEQLHTATVPASCATTGGGAPAPGAHEDADDSCGRGAGGASLIAGLSGSNCGDDGGGAGGGASGNTRGCVAGGADSVGADGCSQDSRRGAAGHAGGCASGHCGDVGGGDRCADGTSAGVGDPECAIAVNMWYDMQFDHKWANFKLVESLAQRLGLAAAPEEEDVDIDDDSAENVVL